MKASIEDRGDKFQWQQEWRRLRQEEDRLSEELSAWMGSHRGVALPPTAPSSSTAAADSAPLPPTPDAPATARSPLQAEADAVSDALTMGELLAHVSEMEYAARLERRQLKACLEGVRVAMAPLRAPVIPAPKAARLRRAALENAQQGLDDAAAALNTLREALRAEALEAEEEAVGAQKSAHEALAMRADAGDGDELDDAGIGEPLEGGAFPAAASAADDDVNDGDEDDREGDGEGGRGAARRRAPSAKGRRAHNPSTALQRRAECAAALNAVGGSSCEDGALASRLLQGLVALQRAYEDDIRALQTAWSDVCEETRAPEHDENGGWTRDAHLAYMHALKLGTRTNRARAARLRGAGAADESGAGGGGGEDGEAADLAAPSSDLGLAGDVLDTAIALVQQMTEGAVVPTRAQVEAHHKWARERKLFQTRRQAREARWEREKGDYVDGAKVAFQQAADAAAQQRMRAATMAAHEKIRKDAHARLESARARKAVEDAAAAAIAAELKAAEDAVNEATALARRERAAAAVKMLEAYRAEQAQVEARIAAVRAQVAAVEAEKRQIERAAGAERIEFRRQLADQRAERAKELAEEAQALEAERESLLERLIASVPYHDRVKQISETADSGRVAAHTAASSAAAELSLAYAAYLKAVRGEGNLDSAKIATHDNLDLAAAASLAPDRPSGIGGGGATGAGAGQGGPPSRTALLSLANQRIREKGLFARNGFSEKQVTSDKRWRFVQGAWAAGVQGSSATRDALAGLKYTGRGAVTLARGAETHEW
jgi:hypothetical protein